MKNGVVNGAYATDFNGLMLNDDGTSAYLGTAISYTRPTDYIAFINPNAAEREALNDKSRFKVLCYNESELYCAYVATKFREAYAENFKALCALGDGEYWGDTIEVPAEFKYEAMRPGTTGRVKTWRKPIVRRKVKVTVEAEMTEVEVERVVNALLGKNVGTKKRVAIKSAVVANTGFYRSASDVTAYVNDLVKYNF